MSLENDILKLKHKINVLTARRFNDMINSHQYDIEIKACVDEINELESLQANYDLTIIEKGV
jgi:hypothetical protein